MLKRIEERARAKLQQAFAPKSAGVLQSTLKAFARFAAAAPRRELFHTPENSSDNEHAMSAWNEWTLILFATYLSMVDSPKTGKPVSSDTISTYVSMARGFFSFRYAFTIIKDAPRLSRFLKAMKLEDPMQGIRRKRRGLRRRHLRKLWRVVSKLRATDPDSVNRWAAVVTAWHCLARGGEITKPAKRQAGSADGPSRADLTFGESNGRRWACVMLRPLKKRGKRAAPKVPQFIEEHDGEGSDAYAALKRMVEHDPVPQSECAMTPLFRLQAVASKRSHSKKPRSTRAMSVGEFRKVVKNLGAKMLGLGESMEWGAHSPRIGGATDLCATGKSSQIMLQAKGRWASARSLPSAQAPESTHTQQTLFTLASSRAVETQPHGRGGERAPFAATVSGDIGKIYNRMTRRLQLAASRLMQRARGRDLEELIPEFVQPV